MRVRLRNSALAILLAAVVSLNHGCVEELSDNPLPNIPPKTSLWLQPDSALAMSVSRQHLHWWADDKDGYVVGYLFAYAHDLSVSPNPDTLAYVFTTKTDSVVLLPIRQSFQNFLIAVRGIDNTLQTSLPTGARVKLTPQPYWDVNQNGMFDGADVSLSAHFSAIDPVGAQQVFPIKNSPPSLNYILDPEEPSRTIQPPETTFTAVTIAWKGTDPDGDETIASYLLSLNDSSALATWVSIPATFTTVTLLVPRLRSDPVADTVTADLYGGTVLTLRSLGSISGLRLNSTNKLYVRARDVAGDASTPLKFPTGTNGWYVRKPQSRLLLVSDYRGTDSVQVRNFYRARFLSVVNGALANYDEYDIRLGSDIATGKSGTLLPSRSVINPMFVLTLKLFDYVFWYTDVFPSLTVAQNSLFFYSTSGGKVIFTTEFRSASDPSGALRDIAPIDSISSVVLPATSFPSLGDSRLPKNLRAMPDSSEPSDIFPQLNIDSVTASGTPISSFINVFMRPIYKRADSRYVYHFEPDTRDPIRYVGMPNFAVLRNDKGFVFFGIPLHYLNGTAAGGTGLVSLFNKIFMDEFGFK